MDSTGGGVIEFEVCSNLFLPENYKINFYLGSTFNSNTLWISNCSP